MIIDILRIIGIAVLGVLILGITVMFGIIIKHIHEHIMKD